MSPLLPSVVIEARAVPVALIDRCPMNPRVVGEAEASDMGDSLRANGQAVKIWLRPSPVHEGRYELVDGERRWRGALARGIDTLDALVGEWSDAQILRIIWITGTEGRSLSVLEQARWARIALQQPGATIVSVAAEVGVARELLSMRLSLLDLPDFAQDAVQSGKLPWTTAYALAMVPGEAQRAAACRAAITPDDVEGPLSHRDTVEMIRRNFARTLKGAPWKLDDPFPSVAGVGPCESCRYRVGNNPEEYGQMKVKGSDFCMHPECFAKKEAAVREGVAAKEGGKRPLSREENALVFRPGHEEPDPASGYALAHRPIPPDLVKDEVSANRAPSFAEVAPAAPVYVATDGAGRCVDVVRIAEAIAGTVEPAIFRRDVVQRYGIADNAAEGGTAHDDTDGSRVVTPSLAAATPKAEPSAGSLAAEEKRQKSAEKAAEKTKAKKLRACAEWLLELHNARTAPIKPAGYDYTLTSLRWEHVLRGVPDEDALLVLRALTEDAPAKGQTAKSALAEYVAGIGGAEELASVVDALLIAGALRAQGVEAPWVVEWHRHLVLPVEEARKGRAAAPAEPEGDVCASAATHARIAALMDAMLPGMSSSARPKILANYIRRACGEAKTAEEITEAEAAKIIAMLETARAGKGKASVTTAAEVED